MLQKYNWNKPGVDLHCYNASCKHSVLAEELSQWHHTLHWMNLRPDWLVLIYRQDINVFAKGEITALHILFGFKIKVTTRAGIQGKHNVMRMFNVVSWYGKNGHQINNLEKNLETVLTGYTIIFIDIEIALLKWVTRLKVYHKKSRAHIHEES